MANVLTTLTLVFLTLLAAGASLLAIRRLLSPQASPANPRASDLLVVACGTGAAAVFLFRWLVVQKDWSPLEAHVDGLTLIAALLAPTMLYIKSRARLPGMVAFAAPLLTIVLAWSVCASHWTLRSYHVTSAWNIVHLASVYLGTLFLALAGVAGSLFLFRQRQLRAKTNFNPADRAGSLEGIETIIIRCAAIGFGVLTLGLIAGVVIVASGPTNLGPGWWHSPKVVLASLVWLIYALVTNVRHATRFRGARAAWLSIVGFILLLATFAIAQALPGGSRSHPSVQTAFVHAGEGR